jgi:hypothetical protein
MAGYDSNRQNNEEFTRKRSSLFHTPQENALHLQNNNNERHVTRLYIPNIQRRAEGRVWSRSARRDMMKSHKPQMMTQRLKGVTTTEEMV